MSTNSSADHPILARLLSSNAQWASDVEQAIPGFFKEGATGQSPKILWIGCADSRVPESVVLAQRPGEVFVCRNVANQFNPKDDSVNAVLSFAVEELGVKHVIITGHTSCGGIVASHSIANGTTPPFPSSTALGRYLEPIIGLVKEGEHVGKSVGELVEINVRKQVENVTQCPTFQSFWKAGKELWVHGWVYELETGKLRDLGVSRGLKGFTGSAGGEVVQNGYSR